MKFVKIHMAEGIGQTMPQPVSLEIDTELPSTDEIKSLDEIESLFARDASLIAEALYNSLPQGARLRLVIELMKLESKNKLLRGIE